VVVLDLRARIIYVNPAALQLSGLPAAELLGKSVRATSLTPRRLRVYRDVIAALETQREWRGEYDTSARLGESRRLLVSVTRVEPVARVENDDLGARFVVSARDVTHQRRLEYIAEATNLVENVGYVFAGLRHELGNPINSIKTALTLLRQTLPTLPPKRVEDYLDRVLVELGRVEYLLRSLHSFNTMNRPTLEQVAVKPFTTRFADIIRKDVEQRGVTLLVDVDDDVGAAIADPRALHQVVLNLVTNALDALAGRARGRIQLSARRGISHVRVLVSDNGPGISSEQRGSIFKPFHTTKARGTGLGLAITRKLVTLMRGTIELETGLGWATTFTITLDAAEPAGAERKSPTLWPPPPRGAA
jgi:PAS domain S-box-containing protein